MINRHIVFDDFSTTRNGKVYNKPTIFNNTTLNTKLEFDAVNALVNMKYDKKSNIQMRYNLRHKRG